MAKNAGNPKNQDAERKLDPGTRLIQLVENSNAKLFHSPSRESFISVWVKDHWETMRLAGGNSEDWMAGLYYKHEKVGIRSEHMRSALATLGAKAIYEGPEHSVYIRVAPGENCIYVDLANNKWEVVEINAQGWRIVNTSPVKFRRTPGMLPLDLPLPGGEIRELRRFVNVADDDQLMLCIGWLVAAFRPIGPYPLLLLEGTQGSAKSTATRVLKALLDPSSAALRSTPSNERDLMIAASNCWCLAYENVSAIDPWLSDCLCRLSTGGSFSVRRHYSNDGEMLFTAQRPVVMNGIDIGTERPDLLDRCIRLTFPEIEADKRRTEAEFWAEFDRKRPALLGAVFDLLACALRRLPDVALPSVSRMADFEYFVAAAEPAMGCPSGSLLAVYTANRQQANHHALECSVIVPPLTALMQSRASWSGTASELLAELPNHTTVNVMQKGWPKTPRQLSGELRRLSPSLSAIGLSIDFGQTPGNNSKKILTIRNHNPTNPIS